MENEAPDYKPFDFSRLRKLKSTDPKDFRHPLDEKAHALVDKLPLYKAFSKVLVDLTFERSQRVYHLSSSIRVSPRQFPRVHEAYSVASYILGAPPIEVYVDARPIVNAYAIGQTRPMIVLTSAAVDLYSDAELTFLIGHEIGHIKCGHMVNQYILRNISAIIGNWTHVIVDFGLRLALLNASRMAELSADRAGLLVVQDPTIAKRALAQMACGSRKLADDIDFDELAVQAKDLNDLSSNMIDNFYRTALLAGSTHPYIILRIKEIMDWAGMGLEASLAEPSNTAEIDYLE